MNVTIITGSPDVPCGVGTYTIRLLCALSKFSDEINLTYLAPNGGRPKQLDDSIRYVNALPGREFRDYVRQNRSEILHLQFPSASLELYWYWKNIFLSRVLYGNRVVITAHESISRISKGLWMFPILVASRIFLVRGKSSVPFWKSLNSNALICIQNPPMLPKVNPTSELRKQIRQQFSISEKKKMVSFLGFLTPSVELEWMLAACNPKEHDLLIVGQIPSHLEKQMDYYETLCQKYGWDAKHILKGYLPDLQAAEILAASDVVFLPFSNGCQESINTSYIAARQQKTYIITTSKLRCGYDASSNTYFVPLGNIELFKRALAFVPEPDELLASDIMTWESLAKIHLDVYKQITKKTKRGYNA